MSHPPRALAFVGVGALGMTVQLATVWACLTWGEVPAAPATAAGVTAAVVHNFWWHRHWTWRDRRAGLRSIRLTFVRFLVATGTISLAGNVAIVWLLVHALPVHGVAANLVAIAVCAAANYWAADRLVFTAKGDCYH